MRKLLSVCLFLGLVILLLAACGESKTVSSSNTTGSSGITEVHMAASDFVSNHVTLHKGDRLRLIDDVAGVHIVTNGTWNAATIKAGAEPGAPLVKHQFNGHDSYLVGPFTTAGIYQLYCTVHLGMDLTVTVQ